MTQPVCVCVSTYSLETHTFRQMSLTPSASRARRTYTPVLHSAGYFSLPVQGTNITAHTYTDYLPFSFFFYLCAFFEKTPTAQNKSRFSIKTQHYQPEDSLHHLKPI